MGKVCWRVLDTGRGGAAFNMALDEALLLLTARGGAAPVLRFFSWERPSLSIGSFQKTGGLSLETIAGKGIPLVRRPTGGRAVLHDAELTYSVAAPIPCPCFPSDLMGSYKVIGSCFVRGLARVGVKAELVPVDKCGGRTGPSRNPLCFSSPSWHEVLVGGRKLVGSAQRRLRGSFLQQGSLLVERDAEGLISLMSFTGEAARRAAHEALEAKMTALSEHRPGMEMQELKSALVKGFEEVMGAEFTPDTPKADELELAEKLMAEKYSRDGWNLYREVSPHPLLT